MTVLLLRGLGRNHRHWGPFYPELERSLGFAPNTLDLPGFGTEHADHSPLNIRDMATSVRARHYENQDSPHKNLTIVALSLSCLVALEWLYTYPEEIHKLILVNGSYPGFHPARYRLQKEARIQLLRALLERDPLRREKLIYNLVCNFPDDDGTVELWQEIERQYPVKAIAVLRQLYAASRFRVPQFCDWKKVVLVASQKDRMVSPRCSEMLMSKAGCPLVYHETAGHDLPNDDPKWLASLVLSNTV
jgi:pimeloyl-[acyl-carrier protein] methyl ester esterase